MKNKLITWAPYIAILFLTAALFAKCQNEKTYKASINALQTENKAYRLSDGKTATSTAVITLPKKQAPKTPETKPFAKVESITKETAEIRIDTVYVPYKDSIDCTFKREGQIVVKEYSFKYRSDQNGFGLQNMIIRDSITLVHGVKRNWFLGPETRTVDISHSNKYLKTTSLSHVEYKDPVKWYETSLFKFGAGLITGVMIKESIK